MKERIIEIEKDGKHIPINVDEIILCIPDGNYCDIYTTRERYKNIRLKLKEVLAMVDAGKLHNIRRVGKSYLMNLDYLSVDTRKRTVILRNLAKPIEMPTTFSKSNKRLDDDGGIVISGEAMTQLLLDLDEKKRKEILAPMIQSKLTLDIEDLNADHHYASGNEYVDLGLPSGVKWSIRNMGGYPTLGGVHYQWNSCFASDSYEEDCFNPEEGDCVNKLWGDNWRMPTLKDFHELEDKCFFTWCYSKRKEYGVLVTGLNGNRIFIPAYGLKKGIETASKIDKEGIYWTSDVSENREKAQSFILMNLMDDNGDPSDEVACYSSNKETWMGYCIRPVIDDVKEETKNKKLVLWVKDYAYPSETSTYYDMRIINSKCFEPALPADPEEALDYLRKWCEKHKPDFILGEGTGCFFVHQLNGYKRFCMYPSWHPSQIINIDDYMGLGKMTQVEIDKFAAMEEHQFDLANEKEPCWMAFYDEWDEDGEFCEHYNAENSFEIPELKRQNMAFQTFILPLIAKLM